MSGFADLVGRNAPALGVNRATYVAGDSWGDTVGVFTDNSGAVINLSGANAVINIIDKPGGTQLLSFNGAGTNLGTFAWNLNSNATANVGNTVATQSGRRELVWSCALVMSGSTVTVWSAVESPLTVLAD